MRNKNQTGLSAIPFVMALVVAAFLLMIFFKVGPLYLDNYFVNSAVQSLSEHEVEKMTNRQIRRVIDDSFTINSVRGIDIKKVKIERKSSKILVSLAYEKRMNFMYNLDIVVVFNNVYDSSLSE